jgi:hypothetical protein
MQKDNTRNPDTVSSETDDVLFEGVAAGRNIRQQLLAPLSDPERSFGDLAIIRRKVVIAAVSALEIYELALLEIVNAPPSSARPGEFERLRATFAISAVAAMRQA